MLDRIAALWQYTVNSRVVWLVDGQVEAQRVEGGILADMKADIHLHDPLQKEVLEDVDIEHDSWPCWAKCLLNGLLVRGSSIGSDDSVWTDTILRPEMCDCIFSGCHSKNSDIGLIQACLEVRQSRLVRNINRW